jgi:hypothetical protein
LHFEQQLSNRQKLLEVEVVPEVQALKVEPGVLVELREVVVKKLLLLGEEARVQRDALVVEEGYSEQVIHFVQKLA